MSGVNVRFVTCLRLTLPSYSFLLIRRTELSVDEKQSAEAWQRTTLIRPYSNKILNQHFEFESL